MNAHGAECGKRAVGGDCPLPFWLIHFVMVVLSDAEFLDGCGSGVASPDPFVVLCARRTFAMLLPAFAMTLTVTELSALLLATRSPSAQVIGPPRRGGVQLPLVDETPTNEAPLGTGSARRFDA